MTFKNITLVLAALQFLGFSSCNNLNKPIRIPNQKITGLKITGIPSKHVDNRRILSLISSQPGTIFQDDKIDRDMRTLIKSGLVDDVDFLVDLDGNKLDIVIEVTRIRFGLPASTP